MSNKYIQKTFAFDTCNHDTEANNPQIPAVSASELKEPSPKRKVGIQNIKVKRRKLNNHYIKHGFFLPQSQETSLEPSAQCMFCNVTYDNNSLAPAKLCNHLLNKHAIHQNKFVQFFQKQTTICASSNLLFNPWLQIALLTKNLYSFLLFIWHMCLCNKRSCKAKLSQLSNHV